MNSLVIRPTADHVRRNGGGDTGWSRAWAISLAARTFQADEVHNSLVHILTVLTYGTSMLDTGPPAPFQADGNFGATAGVVEALVQSHELVAPSNSSNGGYGRLNSSNVANGRDLQPAHWGHGTGAKVTLLRLLPALSLKWARQGGGRATGLRARGGFEIDISWNDSGVLVEANVTSLLGQSAWVTLGQQSVGMNGAATNTTAMPIKVDDGDGGAFVFLPTENGSSYSIKLA